MDGVAVKSGLNTPERMSMKKKQYFIGAAVTACALAGLALVFLDAEANIDPGFFRVALFVFLALIPIVVSVIVVWEFCEPSFRIAKTPGHYMKTGICGGLSVAALISLFASFVTLFTALLERGLVEFFYEGALATVFLFLFVGVTWTALPAIFLGALLGLWLYCKNSGIKEGAI